MYAGRGQSGQRMPSIGAGSVDIRSIVTSIVNFAKSKTTFRSTSPCDGLILKMHYRWTMFVMLGGFLSVWYGWYHRDVISCVSHYNADTQVRLDYINVCLSYPYVKDDSGERRYLLFYRWVHYVLFVLAGVFYIPRKLSKNFENQKLKYLLEKIAIGSGHYENKTETEIMDMTMRYMIPNFHTHNGLYFKHLTANIVALLIDVFALKTLDFLLQNRFMYYGYLAYPYTRDPKGFTDYISQTFPPFASCEIDEVHQLVAKRGEKLGCHLTFMEFYEKIFLFLWVWLWTLMILTVLYILLLFLIWLPCIKRHLLKTAKSSYLSMNGQHIHKTITEVIHRSKVGDIYLLYCLKPHFSHTRFYELLNRINTGPIFNTVTKEKEVLVPGFNGWHPPNQQPIRNRKPGPNAPPANNALEQILLNTEAQIPSNAQDTQLRAPLLKKPNTAVYID